MSATVQDVAAFYVGGDTTLFSGTRVVTIGDTTSGSGAINPSTTPGLSTNTTAKQGSLAWTGTSRYWYDYTGSFVVPSTLNGVQNLSFDAVSNASGRTQYGNFIDAVQVTLKPFVEFTGSATTEEESGGGANLPQVRIVGVVPAGGMTITVNIRAAGTTTTTPSDYTGTANITVPAGTYDGGLTSLFKIPLTVVNDNIPEPTEQIVFDLGTGAGYTVANTMNCGASATSSATYTITDNDLPSISGRVYEDYNYGGGAGRAYNAASGMSLRPNARVELYNSAGTFVTSTTTNASGVYSFTSLAAGNYTVRVVNSTVTSSRTGYVSTLIPVQTFVYGSGAKVGGEAPAKVDAGANTSSAAYSTLNVGNTAAESIADITVGSSSVTGVDFGFNFDTVVNTNAAGQGSLAQFITNSNALKNAGLAQAGKRLRLLDSGTVSSEDLPAGTESSIFMIPSTALTGGVAVITIPDGATSATSVLPAVTDTYTSIDGTTQTVNIGDTNTGLLGTGGSVGYITTQVLTQVPKPEVQIKGTGTGSTATTAGYGLILNAQYSTLRGVSMLGFGGNTDRQGAVFVSAAANALLEQNFLGLAAASTAMCTSSSTATSVGSGVWSQNSVSGTLTHNIFSCNGGNGAHIHYGTSGWTVTNNEFRGNAMNTNNLDGLNLASGSSGNTVRGNLFIDNNANGTDTYAGGGGNTFESNTIKNNGMGGTNEVPGMRIYSKNNTIRYNLIQDNYGSGILVVNYSTAAGNTDYLTGNLISQNSISGNGTITSKTGAAASNQIGIDLNLNTDANAFSSGTAPYVTPNDNGDGDVGGNNVFNFPVFETAVSDGTNATLTGWARPGSIIELFIAAPDPGGFGEGQTYLITLTEGSAADTDSTTSNYTDTNIGSISGLTTHTGTDTTNRFKFVVPLSSLPGVTAGTTKLTATGTEPTANNTSEFSPVILLSQPIPSLTITKTTPTTYVKYEKQTDGSFAPNPGTITYTITLSSSNIAANSVTVTDTLPAGLTNVTVTTGGTAVPITDSAGTALTQPIAGPTTAGQLIKWAAGNVTPGTNKVYTVTATLPSATTLEATQPQTAINNTAKAKGTKTSEVSSTATTQTIYTKLLKQVHNLGATPPAGVPQTSPAWSSTGGGLPQDVLEYCIDFYNYGSSVLNNYSVADNIPANTTYVPASAVLLRGTMQAPGSAWINAPITTPAASVSPVPATGTVTSVVASNIVLKPGDKGTMCFRATIK